MGVIVISTAIAMILLVVISVMFISNPTQGKRQFVAIVLSLATFILIIGTLL